MLGLAPLSSGVPSAQLALYQSRLQQARQKAERAQNEVQSLEAQTEQARRSLAQAQHDVQSVEQQMPAAPSQPVAKPASAERINGQGQPVGRLIHLLA